MKVSLGDDILVRGEVVGAHMCIIDGKEIIDYTISFGKYDMPRDIPESAIVEVFKKEKK